MKEFSKLLIVAGTGRKSGKTFLVCSILNQFQELKPIGIKISPHFHDPTPGLVLLHKAKDYNIFREDSESGSKDSSRMLISGASSAYYIQVHDNYAGEAFSWLIDYLRTERPIICESPALRRYVVPGVFIITDSEQITIRKDLGDLYDNADATFMLGSDISNLKLSYCNELWRLKFEL
jgi:hypothetical protein